MFGGPVGSIDLARVRRRLAAACAVVVTICTSSPPEASAQTAAPTPPSTEPPPPASLPQGARPTLVPPKLIDDPSMAYPEGGAGEAEVVVTLTIGADGVVTNAHADGSNPPFSGAAEDGARAWRFEPATRDGQPVPSKIRVVVVFRPPVIVPVAEAPDPSAISGVAPVPGGQTNPSQRPEAIEDVFVHGDRREAGRTVSLSRNEVRQIPGAFGDPFRALEMMPGVTPIVSGLPFFYIRGAPPGNVGYYLDGVRVPLLFHVGVGPSVVHPALIDRVDLYPGGYPARYGRFAGGIVAGESAPPATQLHGEYNVRLFDAGALAETPFANGKGSVLLGGRYSYTGFLLTQLSPNTTLEYWDYQGRATYEITPDDRIGVFAFGSYDYLGERTPTETLTVFGTEFHRVDVRYDRRLGRGGNARVAATLGLDRSRIQQGRFVRDRMVGARMEVTQRVSDRVLARAGTDLQLDTYDIELGPADLSPSRSRVAEFFPQRSDLAFGARGDVVFAAHPRLEVTPGVRVDLYASQGATAVGFDPRLAMKTFVTKQLRLLTALGIAHQPPAFVVPVPGFQPGGLRGGLQKSVQESAGVEVDIAEGMTATLTGFHNGFYDMSDPLGALERESSGCPPGQFPTGSLAGDRAVQPGGTQGGICGVPRFPPGTLGPDRSGGGGQGADSRGDQRAVSYFEVRTTGNAYGLELFVKKKLTSRLGGFLSYTLSRSTRSYQNRTFVAAFDRTHVANLALAYDLGRNWRVGGRVVFYTGVPAAPDPNSFEEESSRRLPAFFRADARLEKRWQLGKTTWISFIAEWMNATLSSEAVGSSCTLQGCQTTYVGPITIPSVGVEGGF